MPCAVYADICDWAANILPLSVLYPNKDFGVGTGYGLVIRYD